MEQSSFCLPSLTVQWPARISHLELLRMIWKLAYRHCMSYTRSGSSQAISLWEWQLSGCDCHWSGESLGVLDTTCWCRFWSSNGEDVVSEEPFPLNTFTTLCHPSISFLPTPHPCTFPFFNMHVLSSLCVSPTPFPMCNSLDPSSA